MFVWLRRAAGISRSNKILVENNIQKFKYRDIYYEDNGRRLFGV